MVSLDSIISLFQSKNWGFYDQVLHNNYLEEPFFCGEPSLNIEYEKAYFVYPFCPIPNNELEHALIIGTLHPTINLRRQEIELKTIQFLEDRVCINPHKEYMYISYEVFIASLKKMRPYVYLNPPDENSLSLN